MSVVQYNELQRDFVQPRPFAVRLVRQFLRARQDDDPVIPGEVPAMSSDDRGR